MTFNIGSQTAGVINNVARHQRITGGQYGSIIGDDDARSAAHHLRDGVIHTPLNHSDAALARSWVEDVVTEMGSAQPHRSRVAGPLQRLTELLLRAGHLTTAAAALLGPLRTLGGWLGALGKPLLQLLPVLA